MGSKLNAFAITTVVCTGIGTLAGFISTLGYGVSKETRRETIIAGAAGGTLAGIVVGAVVALGMANAERQNEIIAQAQETLGENGTKFTRLLIERMRNEMIPVSPEGFSYAWVDWSQVWEIAARTAQDTGIDFGNTTQAIAGAVA